MALSAVKDFIRFFKSLNFPVGALAIDNLAAFRAVPAKLSPAGAGGAGAPAANISCGVAPASYASTSLVVIMR